MRSFSSYISVQSVVAEMTENVPALINLIQSSKKAKTFSGYSFLNVRRCSFYLNIIGNMVGGNKTRSWNKSTLGRGN